MSEWKLRRTRQCEKCPWRKDVNPFDIPNGYSREKHEALRDTIAKPATSIEDIGRQLTSPVLRIMACHETHNSHCIGWLANQAGDGHNLALRLSLTSCTNRDRIRLVGEQHATFEDTLRQPTKDEP